MSIDFDPIRSRLLPKPSQTPVSLLRPIGIMHSTLVSLALILLLTGTAAAQNTAPTPDASSTAATSTDSPTAPAPADAKAEANAANATEPGLPPGWTALDPGQWHWQNAESGLEIYSTRLNQAQASVRRPLQVCWLPALEWQSFTLTAEVRIAGDHPNRDACLLFAGQSPSQFYYAHLSPAVDGAHHNLHWVNDADRQPVSRCRNEQGLPEDTMRWMPVRLEVDAVARTVRVFVDDDEQPTLTGENLALGWGRIGLGSFDDLTHWRGLRIEGVSRPSTRRVDGEAPAK